MDLWLQLHTTRAPDVKFQRRVNKRAFIYPFSFITGSKSQNSQHITTWYYQGQLPCNSSEVVSILISVIMWIRTLHLSQRICISSGSSRLSLHTKHTVESKGVNGNVERIKWDESRICVTRWVGIVDTWYKGQFCCCMTSTSFQPQDIKCPSSMSDWRLPVNILSCLFKYL